MNTFKTTESVWDCPECANLAEQRDELQAKRDRDLKEIDRLAAELVTAKRELSSARGAAEGFAGQVDAIRAENAARERCERCPRCDRAECKTLELPRYRHIAVLPECHNVHAGLPGDQCKTCAAWKECLAYAVDWRARAISAESALAIAREEKP